MSDYVKRLKDEADELYKKYCVHEGLTVPTFFSDRILGNPNPEADRYFILMEKIKSYKTIKSRINKLYRSK